MANLTFLYEYLPIIHKSTGIPIFTSIDWHNNAIRKYPI